MMHDPTMIWMIVNSIRGDNEHILYTDVNNLYSVAQSEYLPASSYKWCSSVVMEQLEENLHTIPDDSDTGYILCVDME